MKCRGYRALALLKAPEERGEDVLCSAARSSTWNGSGADVSWVRDLRGVEGAPGAGVGKYGWGGCRSGRDRDFRRAEEGRWGCMGWRRMVEVRDRIAEMGDVEDVG